MWMIETFITVHDQNIILDNEKTQKYKQLSKYKYLFVGNGDISLLSHLDNVIIGRDLEKNIENLNYFCDFTAWFFIIKNNLITTKFVSLIQYDTDISDDFENVTLSKLSENEDVIFGYVPYLIDSYDFLGNKDITIPLCESVKNIYNINVIDLVRVYKTNNIQDLFWVSSNNVAMSFKNLEKFINWCEPLIYNMGNQKFSGHAMERSIKIFCILHDIKNDYILEKLKHYQLDSHNTQK
jgi:hypothetical protein